MTIPVSTSGTRPIVAITGLNGFISTHVAIKFLKEGWDVRGSFRSAKSSDKVLKDEEHALAPWVKEGRLQVAIVPDLTGDLTELLKDVQAVAHLAAPIDMQVNTSWEDFKNPTIDGTLNVLDQAKQTTSIKAVTLMSSLAAMFDPAPANGGWNKIYDESDWFPYDEEYVKAIDASTNPFAPVLWYCAAKKYLEFAVNRWVEDEKPAWPVSIICPPMVYGPALQASNPADLNSFRTPSADLITLTKGKDTPLPTPPSLIMVDVRDVAQAFFNAVDKKKSGRFAVAGPAYTYQGFANIMRRLRPDLEQYFAVGNPSDPEVPAKGPNGENHWSVNASKSIKELGVEYTPLEKTISDALDHLDKIGVFKLAPGAWA
ncbi:hypothetical protein I317_05752 [Kwoniella heveanensis CBS 569]|nr:hypothetical protein I317_05752 [Kwoniella heveanensis CBS 569]